MNNTTTTFSDVLSGKAPLKFEVSIDSKSIAILCISVFLVGLALILISKKV